jgi:hypothetical protein
MTRADAIDMASESIRVNCVCPAVIDTNLGGVLPPEIIERELDPVIARTPMRRMGSPVEVANCIAFLCSRLASYVTGSAMTVCDPSLKFDMSNETPRLTEVSQRPDCAHKGVHRCGLATGMLKTRCFWLMCSTRRW